MNAINLNKKMDDCVVFGKTFADPWHRLSCCPRPILVFIEFCQTVGPRPLFHFSNGPMSAHLSLEEVAIWLMSSENAHGSLSVVYNQQIGAYAVVQYGTMLDVTARGFQRQYAVAFLTPIAPSTETIKKFQLACIRAIRPLTYCNWQYFRGVLASIFALLDEANSKRLHSYIVNLGMIDDLPNSSSAFHTGFVKRLKSIANQARPLYQNLGQLCYSAEEQMSGANGCECDCDQNVHKFLKILAAKQQFGSLTLVPLLELAPCAGHLMERALEAMYTDLAKPKPVFGTLFCGGLPVMRNFFGANSALSLPASSDSDSPSDEECEESGIFPGTSLKKRQPETLKMLSNKMIRCIYPLLAGEKLTILASVRQRALGQDLLTKLNRISVRKMLEPVRWHFSDEQSALDIDSVGQLVGITCDRESSLDWINSRQGPSHQRERAMEEELRSSSATTSPSTSSTAASGGTGGGVGFPSAIITTTIVDLNNKQIRARRYTGHFLRALLGRKHLFPNDQSLILHIGAVVSEVAQLAVLARYTSPHYVVRELKLDFADKLLLYNILLELNVTKYSSLKLEAHQRSRLIPQQKFRI